MVPLESFNDNSRHQKPGNNRSLLNGTAFHDLSYHNVLRNIYSRSRAFHNARACTRKLGSFIYINYFRPGKPVRPCDIPDFRYLGRQTDSSKLQNQYPSYLRIGRPLQFTASNVDGSVRIEHYRDFYKCRGIESERKPVPIDLHVFREQSDNNRMDSSDNTANYDRQRNNPEKKKQWRRA